MRFRRGRTALAVLAIATTSVLIAGCSGGGGGGGGSSPSGSPDSGELTFVYLGDANQQKAFNALFAEFNKQYPDIKLKAQGIPAGNWADFSNTVATRLAGGQVIDIIQVATEGQRLFASKGVLADLGPFIEQDKAVVDDYWADINPKLKQFNEEFASGPNGETLFIPGGFNTMGMYLNKSVFDAAGVTIPADGNWTWDEYLAAGHAIKDKTGAYIQAAGSSYFGDAMPWLTTNGASTFNADWTKPTYNSPAAIQSGSLTPRQPTSRASSQASTVVVGRSSASVISTWSPTRWSSTGPPRRRTGRQWVGMPGTSRRTARTRRPPGPSSSS